MAPIAMAVNAMKARTRWTTPLPCWGWPLRSLKECERAGADRPRDEQRQAAGGRPSGPAVVADDPVQALAMPGQGAAQQEVQIHHPVPRAAAVVAFRVIDQAIPRLQKGQQDADGHVDGDPGEREPGERPHAGRGGALPGGKRRRQSSGSPGRAGQGGSRVRGWESQLPRTVSATCSR
jgi:hypothetical protein